MDLGRGRVTVEAGQLPVWISGEHIVSHVRRTGYPDANTLLLPLARVSWVQTDAMTCSWGFGKTVSEEIRTKERGK